MKYTAKYFKESMPEWKRQKDPTLVRFLTRPLSFPMAALCANAGINANTVSIFSTFVGITGCLLFLVNSYIINIIAPFIILFWLVLDCVDGNLARSVRMQPYGDYYDSMSSYVLVGLLGVCLGYRAFMDGGVVFVAKNPFIIVIGALASSSDSLMRLCYQKYRNCSIELEEKGIIKKEKNVWSDHDSTRNIKVRINMELGIATLLPILILIFTLLKKLDVVVLYMLLYYGGAFVLLTGVYMRKAWKYRNELRKDE